MTTNWQFTCCTNTYDNRESTFDKWLDEHDSMVRDNAAVRMMEVFPDMDIAPADQETLVAVVRGKEQL